MADIKQITVSGVTYDINDETARTNIANHNTDVAAHNDIRLIISDLSTRLSTLLDCDDTTLDQLSEIVEYITSNRDLIDAITTAKVSVSDIVDNLTTNESSKPLSAAQGVALKKLIDAIVVPTVPTNVSAFANDAEYASTSYVDKAISKVETAVSGTVTSVNGKSGVVNLSANDVGALPESTTIPKALSELTADTTHRTVTDAEKTAWNAKSNFSGSYNDLSNKPTIPTVPSNISAFNNDKGYLTSYTETDPTVPSWAKEKSKPSYTASEVGAEPANAVSTHNQDGSAHSEKFAAKQDKVNQITSGNSFTLADNTEYILSNVSDLDLVFPEGNFECWLSLNFGTVGTVRLDGDSHTIKYIGSVPAWADGEQWEVSIKNGVVIAAKAEVSA